MSKKGAPPAPDGPAGAFRDPGQKVPAAALMPWCSILNRGGAGLEVAGAPSLWGGGVGGRSWKGLPATGAGAIHSYCWSFGRSHDFIVEVTRENAASEVALAAR